MTPSDVVVRRFRKQSNDVAIYPQLPPTPPGEGNAFTASLQASRLWPRVAAYLFVARKRGPHLPIYREGGWGNAYGP